MLSKMGQQPSSHTGYSERGGLQPSGPVDLQPQPGTTEHEKENVPYTDYSHEIDREEPRALVTQSLPAYPQRGGVTVVHTSPDASWRVAKPIELQKLEKVHRFYPILRSSLDSVPPQEKITDGVHYREILSLCIRYQEHLSEAAKVVGTEQKSLASRLKDVEMFSAGIMQQIIRRQDNLLRTNAHLEKVAEVESALENIKTTLDSCLPLVRRLNSYLPQENRLERFKVHPEEESDEETETKTRDDKNSEPASSHQQSVTT